jgi:hypothetical protein
MRLLERHAEMLSTCGSQVPMILHGNWETEGTYPSPGHRSTECHSGWWSGFNGKASA